MGVLLSVVFLGCATTQVQPISLLSAETDAKAFDGTPEKPRNERDVSVDALTKIMARATWTNRSLISKGGFWLRYRNGRQFFFAIGFDFFRETGVPGVFLIRPEDKASFNQVIAEIRDDRGVAR
jgi:hypothetical protein